MTEQQQEAHVLVIDDDPAVRRMVAQMLERAGFSVIPATDFAAAIKVIESDARIDLLLTDVGMPAGTPHGVAIALVALTKRPNLKVIYMSGTHSARQVDATAEGAAFLAKPFRQDDLLRMLKNALTGPVGAEPLRFASLEAAVDALRMEPAPMVLTRFGEDAAGDVIVAVNEAARVNPPIPGAGELPDRRRDSTRTADVELDYLRRQLIEHGHARQVIAVADGRLLELKVTRIEIAGDDGVYGFVKPRPLQG